MEGTVFAVNTTPYFINLTNTDFSEQFPDGGGLNKTGDILALGYGREGVINKNGG